MQTHHHRFIRSWARRAGYLIAALEAASLLAAAAARADYHVEVCSDLSTGAPSNSSGWTASSSGAYVGATGCNDGGYMIAALFPNASHNYADNGTLTFNAPPNTTINAFALWRWDYAAAGQTDGSPLITVAYDGQIIDNCAQTWNCVQEGSQSSPAGSIVGASGISAQNIEVFAQCGGAPGGVCPAESQYSQIRVYGGDIDLSQSTDPTVSQVAGSLIGPGTHTGVESLSYNASDNGSGVYSASLIIDGTTVVSQIPDSNEGRCAPTRQNPDGSLVFNYAVPCPSSASGSFRYNTGQLSNGAHDVQIVIADAAGNTTTAFDGTIVTQNAASPGGGGGAPGVAAKWSVSLRVTPRHVYRHTRITLAGLVSTSPRPPDGKLVYLQARTVELAWKGRGRHRHRVIEAGPWIIFQALRANANGAFRSTYRFRLGGRHRYEFEAVAPSEGYSSNPTGHSAPVMVTET